MKKRIDNEKTKYLSEMLEPLDFFNHSFDQRQTHINNLLCRYLNTKTVIAFIGAGTSQALWYPGWGQFAKDIICILNILFDSKSPFKTFTEVGLNDALHKEERKFLENIFANEIKQKIIGQIFNIVFRSAKITYKQKNTEIEDEQKRAEYENKQKINLYNEIKLKFQKERPNFAKILAELLKPFVDGKQIEDAISAFLKNNNDERNKKTDIISIKWELYKRVLLDLSNESKQDTTLYEEAKRTYEKKATNPNIKSDDKNFEKYLKLLDHSSENELDALFIFSQCERLLCKKDDWEKNKQSSIFRKIVKTYFKCLQDQTTREEKKLKIINEKNNPYLALQKLPIKKFVTFNYDLEIERALLYGNKISYQLNKEIYNSEIKHEKITEAFGKKSFSQKKQEVDKLAEFLVTRYKETEYSIFHCHGRIDDVSSCIVSEEDYQKWYLKDEPEKYTPFRQTLDITLDSNPVLFMGFGLKDADLMRLLRQITANRPLNKIRTPLFCLLYVGDNDIESEAQIPDNCKWKTFDELHEECDALYMKYGLHVIPVFVNKMRENFGSGDTMCLKLLELFEDWEKWQKGIRQKPKFRKSPAQKSKGDKEKGNEENEYFHYKFEQQNTFIDKFDERFILQLVETVVDKKKDIQKEINNQKNKGANKEKDNQAKESNPTDVIISFPQHLAVVIGDGGTGKSWGVQKFLSGLFKEDMFLALLKLIENRIKDKEIKPRITKFFRQNHKKWKIFFGVRIIQMM